MQLSSATKIASARVGRIAWPSVSTNRGVDGGSCAKSRRASSRAASAATALPGSGPHLRCMSLSPQTSPVASHLLCRGRMHMRKRSFGVESTPRGGEWPYSRSRPSVAEASSQQTSVRCACKKSFLLLGPHPPRRRTARGARSAPPESLRRQGSRVPGVPCRPSKWPAQPLASRSRVQG